MRRRKQKPISACDREQFIAALTEGAGRANPFENFELTDRPLIDKMMKCNDPLPAAAADLLLLLR